MLKTIYTICIQMMIDLLEMTDNNSSHPHLSSLPDSVAYLT